MTINILKYPIIVGDSFKQLPQYIKGDQVCIVTNETIAPLYLEQVEALFSDKQCDTIILADGEQYKNMASVELIFGRLHNQGHHRSSTLIALGGGVVGDMTGFAASCFKRGIQFIQCPTTLLAQVDASIGGKTGVNFKLGKNMIGAFYQPQAVISNIETLKSLPEAEFRCGIAEMIKHAMIANSDYFEWLENNMPAILKQDKRALEYTIAKSAEIKSSVVVQDEKEKNIRAILNFGHTIGHAIEAESQYAISHGDAVAIGMMLELPWSKDLPQDVAGRLENLLKSAGLPYQLPESIAKASLNQWIKNDKKHSNDIINLPVLTELGSASVIQVKALAII